MRWRNSLTKLPSRTEAGLQGLSRVAAIIAAIVLAVMMLLTVADVCGRYFFNSPVKGTWEVVGLLLVCAGTWGLGYCQAQKSHISVTVLIERFSLRVQTIIRSVAYLVGLAGFSLICWRMFVMAKKYFFLPRGNVTDTLEIPYFPFMLALSIGAGIMALILIVDLVHSLTEVARK
jgi:TRAP-type C4-dicarboxylate transport system permease small subunit